MDRFNPHEVFSAERANINQIGNLAEREEQKENMLQLGWYAHRCEAIQSEGELETRLQMLAQNDPAMAERIARSSVEEKQTVVLEEMINAPLGSPEATWFRIHFPSDKNLPLGEEYRLVLQDFDPDKDPEAAYKELDRLFAQSITTH